MRPTLLNNVSQWSHCRGNSTNVGPLRHLADSRPGTWLAACVSFLLGGCMDGHPNEIVHPTAANLPPEGSPVIRGSGDPLGLSTVSLSDWVDMQDALLEEVHATVSLGQLDVDAPDLFGLEIDVALDGVGNIHVLDRRNHAVKIFGPQGHHVGSFGRSGPGPNEFRDPGALESMSDGSLAVVDRGNRIKVFLPTDSGFVHLVTHTVELVPETACSVDDRFFVAGWRQGDDTMIHEIPLSGDGIGQSFGPGYQADYWVVQDQLSRGPIACLGDPVRIVFAFENIPVVRAYSAGDGSVLWTASLEGYEQSPLIEERGAGLAFSRRVIQDIVVSLTPVSSKHLLLQTMRLPPRQPGETMEADDIETRSYLIDALTGQGALISADLPVIIAAGNDYYVAIWHLPFPRLEVRSWSPRSLEHDREANNAKSYDFPRGNEVAPKTRGATGNE